MKLRNKKTGEIGYTGLAVDGLLPVAIEGRVAGNAEQRYRTLAELNEEWEDYDEPKEYWYIDWDGEVCCSDIHDERTERMKLIGNYFETKEEAEEALEKLKAWKRLEDKGFRFRGWIREHKKGMADITIVSFINDDYDITSDLNLLFGGEE